MSIGGIPFNFSVDSIDVGMGDRHTTLAHLRDWLPNHPEYANLIWQIMISNRAFRRAINVWWMHVASGGYEIQGMKQSVSAKAITDEFLKKCLFFIAGFGIIPVGGRILRDSEELVPIQPDFISGMFLWGLSKKSNQAVSSWHTFEESFNGRYSKHTKYRPDNDIRICTINRPGFKNPMGFDSLVVRLFSELANVWEISQNSLTEDYSRTHALTYVHREENPRNNTASGRTGGRVGRIENHKDVFKSMAEAEDEGLSLGEYDRAKWMSQSMQVEASERRRDDLSNTANQRTTRMTFDFAGRPMNVEREKDSVNRIVIPPGWKATPPSHSNRMDIATEAKRYFEEIVMSDFLLPHDGYRKRRAKDNESNSSGVKKDSSWSMEANDVRMMVEDTRIVLANVFDFFIENFHGDNPAPAETAETMLSSSNAATIAVKTAVERLIVQLKSGTSEIDTTTTPTNDDIESAKRAKDDKEKPDEEMRITDLSTYLEYLLKNDLLQTEGVFRDEVENAEQRLEEEVSGEIAELSRELYLQAMSVNLSLREENIRQIILESPQIQAKLALLEESHEKKRGTKSKSETKKPPTKNRPKLVFLEPPAYNPESLNNFVARGLVNEEEYVRMSLRFQRLPEEMIENLMKGVDYKKIREAATPLPQVAKPAAPATATTAAKPSPPKTKAASDSNETPKKKTKTQ